jgi:hypothetical protein
MFARVQPICTYTDGRTYEEVVDVKAGSVGWTGSTPKRVLQEFVKKRQDITHNNLKFNRLRCGRPAAHRSAVVLCWSAGGGADGKDEETRTYEMPKELCCRTVNDAQEVSSRSDSIGVVWRCQN